MEEKNLKRLAKSSFPMDFVEKQGGVWSHNEWVEFCNELEKKGFTPIDFDMVGLLLEDTKVKYLLKK